MSKWEDLKVGTPVCNVEWDWATNYRVEALGHDWAVLRDLGSGEVSRDLLEPDDEFKIGTSELNEEGYLVFKEV